MKLVVGLNEENSEKWNIRLFISVVLLKSLNLTFQSTDMLPESIEQMVFVCAILFFLVSLCYNIICRLRKFDACTLFVGVSITIMYLYAFLSYPTIREDIINRFIWTVVFGVPCFWCATIIKSQAEFLERVKPYTYILTILGTMIFFGDTGVLSSNMTFSAMLLFPFSVHFYFAIKKSKIDLFVCIYETIIVFIHGSRGGILDIVLFVALYFCMKGLKDVRFLKKMLIIAPSALIAGGVAIKFFLDKLLKDGRYIRNLYYLTSGIFFSDNGRNSIQKEYMEKIINTSPIRFRIVDLYNAGNSYPHNIIIEILYNFGYLLGGMIIGFIVFSLLYGMLKSKKEQYDLLMILLCAGFFPLITSFTYLEWPLFWAFLGYLIAQTRVNWVSKEQSVI